MFVNRNKDLSFYYERRYNIYRYKKAILASSFYYFFFHARCKVFNTFINILLQLLFNFLLQQSLSLVTKVFFLILKSIMSKIKHMSQISCSFY
jgi:hypothetical protein